MNIVIVGHVDHGKSTIIGRLLADTGSLPNGKLEQVKANCVRNSKPFEYAFLLDALKDEQSQGITIDSARVFFKTEKRHYIIIDAPGHIEFLKNMITGAARAEAALLVIDAKEGIKENSKRHGYMLSMLGIKQVVVLVNKMDLIDYDQKVYDNIVVDYTKFLKSIKIEPKSFVPVSGMEGENIASNSQKMKFSNQTVLEVLDNFESEKVLSNQPFRMPVQDVYKFTRFNDDRRIIAGNIDTGTINVGDEVVFYPSGKKSKVSTIEGFNTKTQTSAKSGYATGFTLEEQLYVTRGELAARSDEIQPKVSTRINVSIFWLGKKPMIKDKEYFIKIGSSKITTKIEEITRVINTSSLNPNADSSHIGRHEVAECILKLRKPLGFDEADDLASSSRFVIVDDYEITGGGIIRKSLSDSNKKLRDMVFIRNNKWIKSGINKIKRAIKYNQKSKLILITGEKGSGRKEVANLLESKLFSNGNLAYFLGLGSILYGVDAHEKTDDSDELFRKFGEVAHIILDSGQIMISTAQELTQANLEIIKTTIDQNLIETVWIGDKVTTDIALDKHYDTTISPKKIVINLIESLEENGIIFKAW
ncbi:MAG: GTP-binding protein [Candidatus Cloacimonadota bacterium]|nr:GTP-binding protein [Candidatus Cloacimonadota bacterium]